MPVVAVASAFAGASALAAGGLTIFQTIAAIGGIASGIGALTGNEKLMKIGAIAGLAGGFGAFAQGKGWLPSDGGGAMSDPSSVTGALKNTPGIGVENVNPVVDAMGPPVELAGAESVGLADAMVPAEGATAGLADAAKQSSLVTDGAPKEYTPFESDFKPSDPVRDVAAAKSGGILDTFKSLSDWTEKHKSLTSVAGNFIGGMFDDEKKAKTAYYQAQADATRARTANGSAVPRMNARNSGPVRFPTTAPIYTGPRVSTGLYNAG